MVLILSIPVLLQAQAFVEDITKLFEIQVKEPAGTYRYGAKLLLAPVVNYEPATSLGLGVGTKFLFKFPGAGPETRTSNIPSAVTYTLRNQFIFGTEFTIFTNQEKWLIKGAMLYSKFPISYYGIGSGAATSNKRSIDYRNALFEPLLLGRVVKNLFVSGGLRINVNYDTKVIDAQSPEDQALDDLLANQSIGIEAALTFDSRDNVLNALTGAFCEITKGIYRKGVGSSHSFGLTKIDLRKYIRPWRKRPLDVLAFQAYTRFVDGDAPLQEFSTLGGNRLLRGFAKNRFLENVAVFAQAEYRWQALDRIGFVFFLGAGEVAPNFRQLRTTDMKYSVGTGLRLKIVKSENLNIRIDYAYGLGPFRDANFYLNLAETF